MAIMANKLGPIYLLLLLLLALLLLSPGHSSTTDQKQQQVIIDQDTVWTKEHYFLDDGDEVVLFPGIRFTIQGTHDQPVHVHFGCGGLNQAQITVLQEASIILDHVIFEGRGGPSADSGGDGGGGGNGILLDRNADIMAQNWTCQHMSSCLSFLPTNESECIGNGVHQIQDSIFLHNQRGLTTSGKLDQSWIRNSLFLGHSDYAVSVSPACSAQLGEFTPRFMSIEHCYFVNNTVAISDNGLVVTKTISESWFLENGKEREAKPVASLHPNERMDNCIFARNKADSLSIDWESAIANLTFWKDATALRVKSSVLLEASAINILEPVEYSIKLDRNSNDDDAFDASNWFWGINVDTESAQRSVLIFGVGIRPVGEVIIDPTATKLFPNALWPHDNLPKDFATILPTKFKGRPFESFVQKASSSPALEADPDSPAHTGTTTTTTAPNDDSASQASTTRMSSKANAWLVVALVCSLAANILFVKKWFLSRHVNQILANQYPDVEVVDFQQKGETSCFGGVVLVE